jgi:TrmH family RNA methyltransferase
MPLPSKLKRYQKDFEFSYSFGVYPTLELIHFQPQHVLGVLIHSKGKSNQGIQHIKKNALDSGIDVVEKDQLVEKLAPRGNTYAIGVFQKYHNDLIQLDNHIVLVHPSSMGNLGTIMRSMLAFGEGNLALIEPAADAFDPKTIRASMGSMFRLNVQSFQDFSMYRNRYNTHVLYSLMTDGEVELPEVEFRRPCSLIFGEESSGLPEEYKDYGTSVRIPQSHNVDSLNLALSVGISLYQSRISSEK